MALTPRKTTSPRYPGAEGQKSLLASFFFLIQTRVTLPVCLCFLLNCAAIQAQNPTSSLPGESGKGLAQTSSEVESPCRGKFVTPPPRVDPAPCLGKMVAPPPCAGAPMPNPPPFTPPPCKGDVYVPEPQRPPVLVPSVREVSLEPFYFHAEDYLGMRVQLSGILGKMPAKKLVGEGWYLYLKTPPANDKNQFFACPLVGVNSGFDEGSRVTVQGTVSRRKGGPGDVGKGSQTYFTVEVTTINPGSK